MQKLPPVNDPAIKPWARAVEKILADSELQMRGVGSQLSSQSQTLGNISGLGTEVKIAAQIPQAPTGLAVDAVWAWTATGQLSITLKVSWNEVLLDLNDGFVVDPSYEVWVATDAAPSKRINSTQDTQVDITDQAIDSDFRVKVRAVTRKGNAGQFSGEALVLHPALGDLAELGRPSMPTVESANGVVVVHWDGESGAGDILPPYFSHVAVAMSSTQTGDYVYVGQQLQQAGSIVIASEPIGAARWFKLVAFDRLGRISDASDPVLVTVVGVDLGPLQQDLDDAQAAVAQAQTDVAAAQTAIGNMQGDISTALTGPVNGSRLSALTVTADKVIIGDVTNNVPDPDFNYGNAQWNLPTGSSVLTVTDPPNGKDTLKVLQLVANGTVQDVLTATPVPVRPGEQWYAEMWVRRVGTMVDATGNIQLGATVIRSATNGGATYPNFTSVSPADIGPTWQKLSGTLTIPAFGTGLHVRPSIRNDVADGTFQFTEVVLRRMVAGELLVDGTIIATKIATNSITSAQMAANSISAEELAAGAVTADKISAAAVTAEKIAANAIQANHIAAGTITASQLAAGIGGQLDISANQAITLIAGQATDAQNAADSASQGLSDMQTVYNFGATGATISSPNSPLSLALKSDRIEIQSNGNAVSTWTSGQMKVDSFVGTTVELGNHKLEKYTSGGTVVRALN